MSGGLDRCRVTDTVSFPRELRPQARHPAPLDDPDWLIARLESGGERAIAQELGCARETVRRAIKRHEDDGYQMPNRRYGRRRITAPDPTRSLVVLLPPERNLIDRLRADQDSAATEELLVERLRSAHDAKSARDVLGYEAAMFGISTVAARIAQHSRLLRNAA